MPYTYEYPRPAVTVDAVIFGRDGAALDLLVIQRGNPPFEGAWALPGGFVDMDEELATATARELHEETSIAVDAGALVQVGAFGGVERDPRGRVISVVFYATVEKLAHAPVAADDASAVSWFPLDSLPQLAFDHAEVVARARSLAGV